MLSYEEIANNALQIKTANNSSKYWSNGFDLYWRFLICIMIGRYSIHLSESNQRVHAFFNLKVNLKLFDIFLNNLEFNQIKGNLCL